MVIVSLEVVQTPFEMAHSSCALAPMTSPVTPEVADEGVVTVAVPEITVHVPLPVAGAFPAKVAIVTLHKFWSGPAAEVVGDASTLITTSSVEEGQTPLEIVQRKVVEPPIVKPLAVDVGSATTSATPLPKTVDHEPMPVVGVLAANIVVITLHRFWSAPAAATVGLASTFMTTSSVEDGQTPFEIVHLNVDEPPIVNPLTVDVGSATTSALPVPKTVDQTPVPTAGAFPAKIAVITLHKFWSGPAAETVGLAST